MQGAITNYQLPSVPHLLEKGYISTNFLLDSSSALMDSFDPF